MTTKQLRTYCVTVAYTNFDDWETIKIKALSSEDASRIAYEKTGFPIHNVWLARQTKAKRN